MKKLKKRKYKNKMEEKSEIEKKLESIVDEQSQKEKLSTQEEMTIEYVQNFVYHVIQLQKQFDHKFTQAKLEFRIKKGDFKKTIADSQWTEFETRFFARPDIASERFALDILKDFLLKNYEVSKEAFDAMYHTFKDKTAKDFIKQIRPQKKELQKEESEKKEN